MTKPDRPSLAALAALTVLNIMMLAFLLGDIDPHPPVATPLFGIGPFIGACIAAALAAMIIGPTESSAGRILTGTAIVLSLVSFGPQKLLDPALPLIWPALVTAWAAVITLVLRLYASLAGAGLARGAPQ